MDNDLISRSALEKSIRAYADDVGPRRGEYELANGILKALCKVQSAPTVDPVRHGRWLNFVGDFSVAACRECGQDYEVSPDEDPREEYFDAFQQCYKFCPNCGAKMNGGEDDG